MALLIGVPGGDLSGRGSVPVVACGAAGSVVIEQAKGVISERADTDLVEAFARLRAYARSRNLRLTDVAQAAIDGTLDPRAWTAV